MEGGPTFRNRTTFIALDADLDRPALRFELPDHYLFTYSGLELLEKEVVFPRL